MPTEAPAKTGSVPAQQDIAASLDRVTLGLALTLRAVAGLNESTAYSGARELIRNERSSDYLVVIRQLWSLPDEKFVAGLYRALLRRSPDVGGSQYFMEQLRNGVSRSEIVIGFATSEEARLQEVPTQWLSALPSVEAAHSGRQASEEPPQEASPAAPASEAAAVAQQPAARAGSWHDTSPQTAPVRVSVTPMPPLGAASPSPDSVAGRIRSMGGLGKAARYVRRLIYLPWNFQKFFDDYLAFRRGHRQFESLVFERLSAVERTQAQLASDQSMSRLRTEDVAGGIRRLVEQRGSLTTAATEMKDATERSVVALRADLASLERTLAGLPGQWQSSLAVTRNALAVAAEGATRELVRAIDGVKTGQQQIASGLQATLDAAGPTRDDAREAADFARSVKSDLAGGLDFVCGKLDDQSVKLNGRVDAARSDITQWLDTLGRKVQAIGIAVREDAVLRATLPHVELPEPKVLSAPAAALLQRKAGLRFNLGCGEKPWEGYLNVDARPLPNVDITADVRRLPVEPGTVDEIASAHLVEHFRQAQLLLTVLPYWKSLLKEDGLLRIVCPNWAAMLQRLGDGRMSLADFRLVTFGGQDYDGDDHFSMYTPDTLREILVEAGFRNINVVVAERINGLCPEMEITAVK